MSQPSITGSAPPVSRFVQPLLFLLLALIITPLSAAQIPESTF